jgi:hypothetical protein
MVLMTMMRELPGLTGRWKPRSEAMVNTSAMPPRRRAGLLPTHAMSAARLPLLLPIARTILALFLHSLSSSSYTTQKPSQASSDFSSICKAQTNLASLLQVCLSLSLSLPLRSLATLQDQSLVASAYARSPSKCEAATGPTKRRCDRGPSPTDPLDSTRRRSHKRTLREDVKSAMGPFCSLCFFFP